VNTNENPDNISVFNKKMGEELLKLNVLYAFAGKDLMNLNDTT